MDSEQQKTLTKEITDLKNRLQRLEADNLSLQQEVNYLRIDKMNFYFIFFLE